jgi:hypothetical protein
MKSSVRCKMRGWQAGRPVGITSAAAVRRQQALQQGIRWEDVLRQVRAVMVEREWDDSPRAVFDMALYIAAIACLVEMDEMVRLLAAERRQRVSVAEVLSLIEEMRRNSYRDDRHEMMALVLERCRQDVAARGVIDNG